MAKTYTVQWSTTTTHQATIVAESDTELYSNFGFHTYENQDIVEEQYIDGSYKVTNITTEQ